MSRDRQLQKIRDLVDEIEEAERQAWHCFTIATANIRTTGAQGERHFSMENCRALLATARSALEEARTWIQDCDRWGKK